MNIPNHSPYINIKSGKDEINILFGQQIRYHEKANGKLSCLVVGLNIVFSADSVEMMEKKADKLSKFFFDYFLEKESKFGLKNLAYELNALGFRATNHNTVMPALANNKIANAKFQAKLVSLPKAFANSKSSFQEQKISIAA